MSPLILTLQLDEQTFKILNQLRQQHFPPERNFIPAHITLFHALPGEQEAAIRQTLRSQTAQTQPFSLHFATPRFLGRGVAIDLHSPELLRVQKQLADQWQATLTAQDRQRYRPHVTLQNKVAPSEARQLYDQLSRTWKPLQGYGEGLLLWQYQGGPWQLIEAFGFTSSDP